MTVVKTAVMMKGSPHHDDAAAFLQYIKIAEFVDFLRRNGFSVLEQK
jgi:hypothetical protein